MDRGVRQATVHGVTGVGHDLATKSPPSPILTFNQETALSWLCNKNKCTILSSMRLK